MHAPRRMIYLRHIAGYMYTHIQSMYVLMCRFMLAIPSIANLSIHNVVEEAWDSKFVARVVEYSDYYYRV